MLPAQAGQHVRARAAAGEGGGRRGEEQDRARDEAELARGLARGEELVVAGDAGEIWGEIWGRYGEIWGGMGAAWHAVSSWSPVIICSACDDARSASSTAADSGLGGQCSTRKPRKVRPRSASLRVRARAAASSPSSGFEPSASTRLVRGASSAKSAEQSTKVQRSKQ